MYLRRHSSVLCLLLQGFHIPSGAVSYTHLKKFYKEGIKKLDDTVNGDLQDILDRFEVIQSDDVMYLSLIHI